MDIKCYYVVKARTVFHNLETGEIEFRARIKKFENQNPIEARKAAFDFRNEFIYGLLTLGLQKTEDEIGWNPYTKQIEKLSEREIRRLLNPFFEKDNTELRIDDNSDQITYWAPTILNKEDNTEEEINWVAPDDTLSYYSKFNNGIWVVFVHNDNDSELESYDDDIVIDKITKYEEPVPTPPHWTNLEIEYKFYKKHNFETDDIETTINFFDDEEYSEGYDIEDNETEEEAEIRNLAESKRTFKCLKTPFDWTGYDKINWWKEEEETNPVINVNA